jgi:hypothetical protein
VPDSQITAADLYRELAAMRGDVSKALERIAVHEVMAASSSSERADHEARIRILERFRFTLLGAGALTGAGAGWLAAFLQARGGR